LDHFFNGAADMQQPLGKCQMLRPANPRILDKFVAPAVAIDHSVARCAAARVDANHSHRAQSIKGRAFASRMIAQAGGQPAASISSAGMSKLADTLDTSSLSSSASIKRSTCWAVAPATWTELVG